MVEVIVVFNEAIIGFKKSCEITFLCLKIKLIFIDFQVGIDNQ